MAQLMIWLFPQITKSPIGDKKIEIKREYKRRITIMNIIRLCITIVLCILGLIYSQLNPTKGYVTIYVVAIVQVIFLVCLYIFLPFDSKKWCKTINTKNQ